MTENKYRAIFFDLAGVLIEDAYQNLFREVAYKEGIDFMTFTDSINKELGEAMQGTISERELYSTIIDKYNLDTTVEDILQKTQNGFTKIEETWKIVQELEGEYVRGIITNMGRENALHKMKKFNLEEYFEVLIFSSDIFSKKPSTEIFETALERAQAKPEETIFIDDNSSNTRAAEKLGIKSITFEDPIQLREELESIGVLNLP